MADMKYDALSNTYSTVPDNDQISQRHYNKFIKQCKAIARKHDERGAGRGESLRVAVVAYLSFMNNPTADRAREDIQKIGSLEWMLS